MGRTTRASPTAIQSMSQPRFSDRTAFVTGGASGLGLAIARRLHSEGAFVVAFDFVAGNFAQWDAEFGGRGYCVQGDVASESDVRRAVETVLLRRGRIDILVNSAGITGRTNLKSHDVALEDLEAVLRVNLVGSFLTSKHVLPAMLKNKYGRILHIASIAGKDGNAGMLAYSASKAAVIGMTKVQGKEYAEEGITVNALAPAVVQTPMVSAMPETQVKYMTDKIPMKRCGSLEEVAAMAAFIVSAEASLTTGFTFDLTGGRAVY